MNPEQLARLKTRLNSDKRELAEYCSELISAGVEYKDIIRAVLAVVAGHAVVDESWLPTASIINLSDSLVHVPLQLDKHKHHLMVFGEQRPPFRRIKVPPRESGDVNELRTKFETAALGNDWQLGERCLLGIAEESGLDAVLATLLATLLLPRYLGSTSGPWWSGVRHQLVGGMIDLHREYGDKPLRYVVCNKGAKQCAKAIETPNERTRFAMEELRIAYKVFEDDFGDGGILDEDSFRADVESGQHSRENGLNDKLHDGTSNVRSAFRAVTSAWQSGVSVQQIDLAITMVCVDRLLRRLSVDSVTVMSKSGTATLAKCESAFGRSEGI